MHAIGLGVSSSRFALHAWGLSRGSVGGYMRDLPPEAHWCTDNDRYVLMLIVQVTYFGSVSIFNTK